MGGGDACTERGSAKRPDKGGGEKHAHRNGERGAGAIEVGRGVRRRDAHIEEGGEGGQRRKGAVRARKRR